ncbi:MAG: deoxyguanosinetriphosphate triphosphohydrolase, partial [Hyphomicrobiales bacterium]
RIGIGHARNEVRNDATLRARIVADFIAGMTDPYALDEHQRLFDARPEFR